MAIKTTINPKAIDLGNFEIIKNINTSIDNINNDMYDEEGDGRKLKLVTDESLSVKLSEADLININNGLKVELDLIKASQGDSTALGNLSATVNGLQINFNGLQSNLEQCSIIATNADNTAKSAQQTANDAKTTATTAQQTATTAQQTAENALSKATTNSDKLDNLKLRDLSDYEAVFEPYFKATDFDKTLATAIKEVDVSVLKDDSDTFVKTANLDIKLGDYATVDDLETAKTELQNSINAVNDKFDAHTNIAVTKDNFQTHLESADIFKNSDMRDFMNDLKSTKTFKVIVGRALSAPNDKHKGSQPGKVYYVVGDTIQYINRGSGATSRLKYSLTEDDLVDFNNSKPCKGMLVFIKDAMPAFNKTEFETWVYNCLMNNPRSSGHDPNKSYIVIVGDYFSCNTESPFLKVVHGKVICSKPVNLPDSVILDTYSPSVNLTGPDIILYALDPFGGQKYKGATPLKKTSIYNAIGSALNEKYNLLAKTGKGKGIDVNGKYKIYRRRLTNSNKKSEVGIIKNTGINLDEVDRNLLFGSQYLKVKQSNIRENWNALKERRVSTANRRQIATSPQLKVHSLHRGRYVSNNFSVYNTQYSINYDMEYLERLMDYIRSKSSVTANTITALDKMTSSELKSFFGGQEWINVKPHNITMRMAISQKI